ncbi:hypothetical protein KR009_000178 [Drosophila setifemur]|nr:hypothetical protein KR009_000178 [Drosophila setifemur]
MSKCPRCNCDARGENRLVTDSCGHSKCRLCLVADVSDCLECRISSQETAPPQGEEIQRSITANEKILVTEKGYHCTVCNKDFRSRTQQYYHRSCGDDLLKKFSCKVCGRRFATRSHLRYHTNSHDNPSKHACNICGKKFQQQIVLQRHLRTHSQEQHVCPHCPKVFRSESTLKAHLPTHSDLGLPYKCEQCSKSFQSKANLKQHCKKHDQNSIRHKCKVCQKSFLRQTTLRLHMKRHSQRERQSCNLCGRSYNDVDALARHLKQHQTKERYRCTECDITVNRKDNMRRHMRSMHPGVAYESLVEVLTPSSTAVESTMTEERQPEQVRYSSVIQSVGNVEPMMLPPQIQPLPLPEVPIAAPVPLPPVPDTTPKGNVQLYRKIILDLDNEEYLDEGDTAQNAQYSALQQRHPQNANFSEMHWRKNFKYSYENEHTN